MSTKQGIFQHELQVIENSRLVAESSIVDTVLQDHQVLLREYEKLLKTTRRLVRHADRSEAKLNSLAQEAQEKSRQLEKLSAQLAKYLSPQVYESIFSGKQQVSLVSYRKKLTIFFSDLVGFTPITETLESEDLTAALNYYLDEMSAIALDFGATIDKYIGDAIMIFFGDPESQGIKEDARRCVQMAIEMQNRLDELSNEWGQFGLQEPFQSRMGINTGYCTVGNFGSENRMDYTVIGGGVNIAARLESAAKAKSILLSYDTYDLIKDQIPCVESEKIKLKGITHPVRTFQVLNETNEESIISISMENSQFNARLSDLSADDSNDLKMSLEIALDKLNKHLDLAPKESS